MKLAETVTFGGSGLDRAAWMRGDGPALAAALADGRGAVLPIWRGKPLMEADGAGQRLVWLAGDHPMLADAPNERLFLGDDDGMLPPTCHAGIRRSRRSPRWTVSPMTPFRCTRLLLMGRRLANCGWRWRC